MIRVLRKRPRSDNLANQARKRSSDIGRRIYLVLLALFALVIADYLWGDLLMMRGSGLVLRDKNVVATGYVARVAAVYVEEGKTVKKDDLLLRIESMDLLERLADLSMRQADLTQKAAGFQLRSETVTQLLPLATRRERETGNVLSQFDKMANRGLITSTRYEDALRANFEASAEVVKLTVEKNTLQNQISALDLARADAAAALKKLQDHYAAGAVYAASDGSVGTKVPSVGDVYRPGDPILTVYTGESYVLTYLPSRYLFPIRLGMRVTVSSGRHSENGEITEILPLSGTLPQEFQNIFKPRERNQLAKIKLSDPTQFPIFEKVEVSRRYF